jgi:hypothetical protein
MKIFISWSGNRSLALAEALRGWLPLVLHYIEPWLSKADIDAGKRWDDELSKTLNECNFGISCVTSDNLNSPWLLFEAGALAKSVEDGKLVPLLLGLDMKDFSGPLSRFQAKKAEQVGVMEILDAINKASATPIPEQRLADLFELAWDKLEERIAAIPAAAAPAKPARTQSDILEELVSSVRNFEARIRDGIVDDFGYRPRRRSKMFSPMMMEDLIHRSGMKRPDPIQIVVIASFFRDDAPWLYEIGIQAYRSIAAGSRMEAKDLLRSFQRGLETLLHGPWSRDLSFDRDHMQMIAMEAEVLSDQFIDRMLPRGRNRQVTDSRDVTQPDSSS